MGIIRCCCSACGAKLNVSEQYAGRRAKCPKCSAAIEIPTASDQQPPPPEAAPHEVEESQEGFPHIVTDSSGSGDGAGPGSAGAALMSRRGDRRVRLALLITAACAVLLIVAVGAFSLLSSRGGSASAPSDRPSSPSAEPEPVAPATPASSGSTLVLDWPEGERSEAMVYVDGSERPVPASGKAEFPVQPGDRTILIKRRGYGPVEVRIAFEQGGRHHYRPEWKQLAQADPEQPEQPAPEREKPIPQPEQPTPGRDEPAPTPEPTVMAGTPTAEPSKPAGKPATPPAEPKTQTAILDPEEFLAGKNLRRLSGCYALVEESKVSSQMREVESLRRKAFAARPKVEEAQKRVDDKKALMLTYVQQSRELGAKLNLARNVEQHNQIVTALNELDSRVLIMRESKQEEKALEEARAAASSAREQYVENLLELRQLYDRLGKEYDALDADPAVGQAIAQYNEANSGNYRLGPSPSLARLGIKLERLEETVLTGAIDLRRGPGGLWYVTATFNGKASQEMAIDTGASVIALPWDTAVAVALTPGPSDAKVLAQMADGRFVEAHRVVAETVRVGEFTAKNVECSVMPPGPSGSTPLLGLSFFKHFDFRIDSGKGQLMMSQLDTSDTGERGDAAPSRRP